MAVPFPELPYPTDNLEPYISERTLEYHYGKHHKAYVETLNTLIKGTPFDKWSLDEIMRSAVGTKVKVYNNAAQAWNHSFFWRCMTASNRLPSGQLEQALTKNFGSVMDFQQQFESEAQNLFGSGWVWLVKDSIGRIKVRGLSNAGNPIAELGEVPLLACDVWEHAYYLDYQNERPRFVKNFWNLVDWKFVEMNLDQSSAQSFKFDPGPDLKVS